MNVLSGKVREIAKDFLDAHTSSEVLKYVIYGNAQFPDAGLAPAPCRIN